MMTVILRMMMTVMKAVQRSEEAVSAYGHKYLIRSMNHHFILCSSDAITSYVS